MNKLIIFENILLKRFNLISKKLSIYLSIFFCEINTITLFLTVNLTSLEGIKFIPVKKERKLIVFRSVCSIIKNNNNLKEIQLKKFKTNNSFLNTLFH